MTKIRGAALLMALLVVAIVAAIAAALIAGEQIAIKRTQFTLNAAQARLDLNYSAPWILTRLQQLAKDQQQNQPPPTWPQTVTTTLSDQSQIQIDLWPAGMRFNVNNLGQVVSNYNQLFINLLQMADPNLSGDQAKTILQNIQTELFTPNKAQPNQINYLISPSQLRVVTGMTSTLYMAIIPYLIAIPDSNTAINVNAAPQYVLAAMLNKDQTAAQQVVDYRRNNGSFTNTSQFLGLPAVQTYAAAVPNLSQLITTTLDKYYLAHITITRDGLQYEWYVMVQFAPSNQTLTTLYIGSSL